MADVSIRIKPIFDSTAALASANRYGKEVVGQDRAMTLLNKHTSDMLKKAEDGFMRLKRVATETTGVFSRAFSATGTGLQKFSSTLDGVVSKFLNLKTAILASSAAYAASKFYQAGAGDLRTERRVKREFGDEAEGIMARARRAAGVAGVENNEALKALTFIARGAGVYQAGERVPGLNRPITEGEASRLRLGAIENGAKLYERLQTLNPELGGADLGRLISNSLSGPEGLRGLAAAIPELEGNRKFAKLARLSDAGKVKQGLTAAELGRYGAELKERGGSLSPLSLVELSLARGGVSVGAAAAERNTNEFRIRKSEALVKDKVTDLSKAAIEKATKNSGGFNIANFTQAALGFAERNAGTISAVGAGVGGLYSLGKGVGAVRGLFGKSKLGSLVGAVGDATATPVRVVNFGDMGKTGIGGGLDNIDFLNKGMKTGLFGKLGGLLKGGAGAALTGGLGGAAASIGLLALAGGAGYGAGKLLDKYTGASNVGDWLARKTGAESGTSSQRGWSNPVIGNAETQQHKSPMGAASVKFGGINISVPFLQNPAAFIESMMPHIKRQLMEELSNATANGTAPISAFR